MAATHDATALRRAIGGRMLIVFIVGDILGAGIYGLPGKLAGFVGGAIWLPFAIGFVIAGLTAGSYAELVGKYPKAAGAALYTHRAFGKPFFTFIVAFAVMMSGIASASAAAMIFGGDYLAKLVEFPQLVAAFGFLAIVTTINFIGISESIKVNFVFTMIELSGLAIVIVVGVIAISSGQGDVSRAFDLAPHTTVLGIFGATALGFYALIGFEDSVNLAEECEEPARTFPRALFMGIAFTGVIYIVISIITSTLVPPSQLTGDGPLLRVVQAGSDRFPPELFAVIALFAICNTALINMIMASRLLYGMANEQVVPAAFARVHAGRRTPWVAILFTVAISVALILTSDVKELASTTTFLLLLVFGVVNVAVLVLRRRPVEHRHFRTPTWAAAIGAVATLALASPLSERDSRIYLIAAILLGVGAVLWGINRVLTGKRVTDINPEKLVK
jgi:amino acid transporter